MAETYTATFLFTDLVGSTALSHSVTPREAEDLRRSHFELLRGAIESTGGREVKNLGDGVMVVFTSAARALACATAMQQAVERHNRRTNIDIGLRVGLSTGEATEEDGDFFGDPVVEAARLCAVAGAGQVLATNALQTVVGRHASQTLRAIGSLDLKGLSEPVSAVELIWEPVAGQNEVPLPFRLVGSASEATFGFVGRTDELEEIEQALKDTKSSSLSELVLIGGEPGVGKTSLAGAAARRAHESGVVVTFGACEEGLGVAFQPWLSVISHIVEHLSPRVTSKLRPVHAAALRRLVPHLTDRLPDHDDLTAGIDTERVLLLDAAAALLAAASDPDGLVVVLDDLQWADLASLQLLVHLIRSPVPTKALIVATFRPGDLDSSHPLSGLLADVRNESRVCRYDLQGLGDDDIVGLIEIAAGHRLDDEGTSVAHALRRETGGNPFFVVEVLRHLGESGYIVQRPSGEYGLRDDLSALALPASVRDVVSRRVGRLGDESVRTLSLASVVGQEFDLDVLAEVAEIDEDHLLDLLERASRASLVAELAEPPGRYRFSHALVQSSLYSELSPARRQRSHQRVAEVLERRLVPGEAAAVAHHLLAAVKPADADKAVDYSERAGDEAFAALAPADAARWYSRALDALERSGQPDDHQRARLLVAVADSQSIAGQEFRPTLREAAEAVVKTGDVDLLVRAALVRVPGTFDAADDPDPAQIGLIEQALAAIGPADSPIRARLLVSLGDEYGVANHGKWADLASEAWDMAERLKDQETLLVVYSHGASGIRLPDRFRQRQEWDARAKPLIANSKDLSLRIYSLTQAVLSAAELLDWDELERLVSEMEHWVDTVRLDIVQWEPLLDRAWMNLTRGNLAEGERYAAEAFDVGQRLGLSAAFASYGAQIMMHRLATGRLAEILDDPAITDAPLSSLAVGWQLSIVWLCCQDGQLDRAATRLAELRLRPGDLPFDSIWIQTMCQLGDCAAYLDEPELAARCYNALLPYEKSFWYSGAHDIGYVARYLGRMAQAMGRPEEAERHLRYSLQMHHEKGLPYWEARSALDLAALGQDRIPNESAELVATACELASRYGFAGAPFAAAQN